MGPSREMRNGPPPPNRGQFRGPPPPGRRGPPPMGNNQNNQWGQNGPQMGGPPMGMCDKKFKICKIYFIT